MFLNCIVPVYKVRFWLPLLRQWLQLLYFTEIDQEGVIAGDTDPAQEMGDESMEVFC